MLDSLVQLCLDNPGVVFPMDDLIPCLANSFFTGLQLLAVLSPLGGDGLSDGPLLVGLTACFKALGLQGGGLGL